VNDYAVTSEVLAHILSRQAKWLLDSLFVYGLFGEIGDICGQRPVLCNALDVTCSINPHDGNYDSTMKACHQTHASLSRVRWKKDSRFFGVVDQSGKSHLFPRSSEGHPLLCYTTGRSRKFTQKTITSRHKCESPQMAWLMWPIQGNIKETI
jgi:hypothetical protein